MSDDPTEYWFRMAVEDRPKYRRERRRLTKWQRFQVRLYVLSHWWEKR